ncbi:MAG: type II secretion system major pseudopilin GspG [Bdellovibrionales bacterium]|nr:type II secretion system major pseudopilin GspG [Bdellovibrionales bacterium]
MIRNRRGMTLLEIMIVLAIVASLIGILAGQIRGRMKKAQMNQAKIQIGELSKALDNYYTDCNSYPPESEGFQALVSQPTSCTNWGPEPYLKRLPKDPWGQDFIYKSNGSSFSILSYGADKKEGGAGEGADISSETM